MSLVNSQRRSSASFEGPNHTLHLYTSDVDKYSIQKAFLAFIGKDERAIYITGNDPVSFIQDFDSMNVKLEIIKPENIKHLENQRYSKLRIIIDAGSMPRLKDSEIEERERYISKLGKRQIVSCLCTYDVTKLNPGMIRQLATCHNHLQLTTSDLTILSGDIIDKSKLSDNSIEKMVKDNLETIILALLQKKPMCGSEIIGTIHMEFNVLLSPGTIYPLLQSLKERGLLVYDKNGKAKTYAPAKDAELKIRGIIEEHIQTRKLLTHYLQKEPISEEAH